MKLMNHNMSIVSKEEIVEQVKQSRSELRMLGTTAFDMPWQKSGLDRILFERYCKGEYEITIVSESDPTLYSDALLSAISNSGVGTPMATLTETRHNSTLRLRSFFRSQTENVSGLDPEEDIYRKKLDAMYTVQYAKNICTELNARGYSYDGLFEENEDGENILSELLNSCVEKMKSQLDKSDIVEALIRKRNYSRINKVSERCEGEVVEKWEAAMSDVDAANNGKQKLDALLKFAQNEFKHQYLDSISKEEFTFVLSSKDIQDMCLDIIMKYLEKQVGSDYDMVRKYASESAYNDRAKKLQEYKDNLATKQRFTLKQVFHPIPIQMLRVDGVLYATLNPLPEFEAKEFLYVGNSNLTDEEDVNRFAKYEEYARYFDVYLNSHYTTEETKKGNKKEVIYNYSFDHAVVGQMPRDSFYGSDNYKLVMWALVFDRQGRILIHKRSNNAKDNQGMWDKSVGGHIAIKDKDTIVGASREIAEELYSVEEEEQGHTRKNGWSNVNKDNIIYLGKWKETRYPNIGSSLHLEPDEFYSFSFDSRLTEQPIDSMRVLPDGTRIKAKCFVDFYFVIASEEFRLDELKNSKYLVLSPGMIKECAKMRILDQQMQERIKNENPENSEIPSRFEVTPDLEYMINSPEWDNEITKFSIRVKEAFAEEQ